MSDAARKLNIEVDVEKELEIAVRVTNEEAVFQTLLDTVASDTGNVLAHRPFVDRYGAVMLMVTKDLPTTQRALDSAGYRYQLTPVVLAATPYGVGFAARLGLCLQAAGIGIVYSYASPSGSHRYHVVFKTTDDNEAVRILRDHVWDMVILRAASVPNGESSARGGLVKRASNEAILQHGQAHVLANAA